MADLVKSRHALVGRWTRSSWSTSPPLACSSRLCWPRLPEALWLLAAHLAAGVLLWWRSSVPTAPFLLPPLVCPALRGRLLQGDGHPDPRHPARGMPIGGSPASTSGFWGAHPTVWLERIHSPVLTEFLQVVYALFIPAVLLVPLLFWRRRRYAEFRYVRVPDCPGLSGLLPRLPAGARARAALFPAGPAARAAQRALAFRCRCNRPLDRLESAHYDCFPSGHTELTIIAWWG